MSTLVAPFNPMQFDPSQGAGSLPIGRHPVVIESSEVKANKSQDGGYLQFNLRIIDGLQQGASGAYRLNLYSSNVQAVEIANRQLSAVCHVVGRFQLGASGVDVSVLHNIPFIIEVGSQKNDAAYTEVKKVFDINGNEPNRAGNVQSQQAQAAPSAPQAQAQPAQWASAPQTPAQPAPSTPVWGQQQQPAQAAANPAPAQAGWTPGASAQAAPTAAAAPWGAR